MSEYPWNEKNNTFTWLSSLYNPFKDDFIMFTSARAMNCENCQLCYQPVTIENY